MARLLVRTFFGMICLIIYMTFTLEASKSWGKNSERNYEDLMRRSRKNGQSEGRRRRSEKPNIIVIVTDDQDEMLGSMTSMRQTLKIMGQEGIHFKNSFVITPMCCPSRSTFLTGMFPHNHHVYTNNDNCSGIEWQREHEPRTFAKYLSDAGYRTGIKNPPTAPSVMLSSSIPSYNTMASAPIHAFQEFFFSSTVSATDCFPIEPSSRQWTVVREERIFAEAEIELARYFGKYLNEYNGTYVPPGWREWVGLVRNSRYYNYTLNFNGQKVKHDDNYFRDYFTDLIANDSVTFMKMSKQHFPDKPVMMMLSVPAPHGPEDSAPQYQHMFENNTLHRTPSWNYMNNSDKQWLLKEMKPLDPSGIRFTDLLQQKRLQTLQSVDSLVEKVYYNLRYLDELDNTYMIYTSDHGYHLGQYGIVKGKALPYDFDIRVPLYIRGPGILRDTKIPNVVGNIDIAPTILDMAGIEIPEHMEGRSLLKLMKSHKQANNLKSDFVETKRPWRDTLLIERGKVTKKLMKDIERENNIKILEDHANEILPYAHPKLRKTLKICLDPNNKPPCKMNQKWVCFRDNKGRRRTKKCRNYNKTVGFNEFGYQRDTSYQVPPGRSCNCSRKSASMTLHQQRLQRQFLNNHMKNSQDFEPHFIQKRSLVSSAVTEEEMRLQKLLIENSKIVKGFRPFQPARTVQVDMEQQLNFNRHKCRHHPDGTFTCDRDVIEDPEKLLKQMVKLDDMIEETRRWLQNLKKMRKNMKKQKKLWKKEYYEVESNESELPVHQGQFYSNSVGTEPCNCEDDYKNEEEPFEMPDELTNIGQDVFEDDNADSREEVTTNNYPIIWTNKKRKRKDCNHSELKCTIQDNDHWHTPPYWTYGPYCYCTNANTNTYWCLRTVNETHNFLYCEFIDSFLSYYDFITDPYQLTNQIKSLDYGVMQQLHEELTDLRRCKGVKQCNKTKQSGSVKRRRRRRRRRKVNKHYRRLNRHIY